MSQSHHHNHAKISSATTTARGHRVHEQREAITGHRCAQRLSASRAISVVSAVLVDLDPEACSTPFGITVYLGCRLGEPLDCTVSGAQRLSASRSISGDVGHGWAKYPIECSTPFGITVYLGGRIVRRGVCRISYIECSTPFGITVYLGLGARAPLERGFRCSTPFGITVYLGC